MPDLTLAIRIVADGSGFKGEVHASEKALDKLTAATGRASKAGDRQASASARLAKGMSSATIANRRLVRGMGAAGAAARRQAKAARQAATANQGLVQRFRAAHGSVAKYTLLVAGSTIALGELYALLRRLPGAVLENIDANIELNNSLRLITSSEAGLVAVRGELLAISQRTRTSLAANAQLYRRISVSSEETGHSTRQLLTVTELLNKQVLIGGNNASEAEAGLVQFTQGLASGRLQGDELRLVMENLLGVQQGLVDGFRILRQRGQIDFDVTRGNIRDLAQEGKLSAELLIEAILASARLTEERFKSVEVTVSGAAQIAGNAFLEFTGRLDETTRASNILVGVLLTLTDVIEAIGGIESESGLIRQVERLEGQLENRFLAPGDRRVLERQLREARNLLSSLRQERTAAARAEANQNTEVVRPAQRREQAAAARAGQPTALSALDSNLRDLVTATFSAEEKLRDAYQADLAAIKAGGAALEAALKEQGLIVRDVILARQQQLADDLAALREPVEEHREKLEEIRLDLAASPGRVADQDILKELDALQERNEALRAITDYSTEAIRRQAEQTRIATDVRNHYREGTESLIQSLIRERQAEADLLHQQQLKTEVLQQYAPHQADQADKQRAINDLHAQGLLSLEDYSAALAQLRIDAGEGSLADGFIVQLERMEEASRQSVADIGAQFAQLLGPGGSLEEGFARSAARAVVFGESFKQSVGNVAREAVAGVIQSLIQLAIRTLITQRLVKAFAKRGAVSNVKRVTGQATASAFQAAQHAYQATAIIPVVGPLLAPAAAATALAASSALGAGAIAGAGAAAAFASGGVVDSPTYFRAPGVPLGVAGESGPEAILPLRRGPGGRLGVGASGAARHVTLDMDIAVSVNAEGISDPADGEALGLRIAEEIDSRITARLHDEKRPGGILNPTGMVA